MKSRTSHAKKKGTNPHDPGHPVLTGLGEVVRYLNRLAHPQVFDPKKREAWAKAERVLAALVPDPQARQGTTIATQPPSPDPVWAVGAFNRLARQVPVPLVVQAVLDPPGDKMGRLVATEPRLRRINALQEAVWFLWRYVFDDQGWLRLRRCKKCSLWFEDQTRNRSQEFCNADCLNRYWNRAKRRNAGAAALKKKGKARLILERLKRQEARSKASKPAKKGKHAG